VQASSPITDCETDLQLTFLKSPLLRYLVVRFLLIFPTILILVSMVFL